jgi:hypothetical protein
MLERLIDSETTAPSSVPLMQLVTGFWAFKTLAAAHELLVYADKTKQRRPLMDPAGVSGGQPQRGPIRQVVVVQVPAEALEQGDVVPIPLEAPFNPQLEEYRDWRAVSHTFTLRPDGGAVLTVLFELPI